MRKLIIWLFSYKFIVNSHTGRAHKISGINDSCGLRYAMPHHLTYLSKRNFRKDAYHHCPHCF